MTIVLRELTEGDLDAVAAIEAAGNPQPWSRSLFAGELDLDPATRHWLVACTGGGDVVGFGGLRYALDTAHLLNLGVHAIHTKQGVGYRLCQALVADAVQRAATCLTLEVRVSNEPAIALYRKLGMQPAGSRPGYYADGEDAMILWLRDLPTAAGRATGP
jgi:ribosomal-protein-alanine N-acetyltransferase